MLTQNLVTAKFYNDSIGKKKDSKNRKGICFEGISFVEPRVIQKLDSNEVPFFNLKKPMTPITIKVTEIISA